MKHFRLFRLLNVAVLFALAACQPVVRQPEKPAPIEPKGPTPIEQKMPILIEHKIPTHSAHAGGIKVGPFGGALWFIETGANQIGRITVDGVVTEFPIPTEDAIDDSQGFVALGPDAAIWFNEDRVNKLGRIALDGKITEFDLPKGIAPIREIVAGPDGALWVTAVDANKIVKLSTAGKLLAEYVLPKENSRPVGMVLGPDGAFWFIEAGANQIGRITVDGEITGYAIPSASSFPLRLTVGPDKALWFTMYGANKIGRISLEGKITTFDVAGMQPVGIAAGADGALWFTSFQSTEIGRLTVNGVLTKLSVPTYAAVPYHIAAGPDGNLWFTEQQGNQIGQIKLPVATIVAPTAFGAPKAFKQPFECDHFLLLCAPPTFSSKTFKLPMSVSFGPAWHVLDDYPDLVTLQKKEQVGWQLGFNLVNNANLTDPVDGHLVPFPDDFVSWIKSDPNLATSEATEVMVGGIKGIQIDIRSTTMTKKRGFLYLTSGIIWNLDPPAIGRFILLNNVNGERVFIWFVPTGDADKFKDAVEEAQAVLHTVVFSKP